jgi:hypothetical protein
MSDNHREIRKLLRKAARDPLKVDRLSDDELDQVAVKLCTKFAAAALHLQALCGELAEESKKIIATLSIPELE